MKFNLKSSLIAGAVCLSAQALANDATIDIFLGEDPIEKVEVRLNGKMIGSTNSEGRLVVDISAGNHSFELFKNDALIGVFPVALDGQNEVEVKALYSTTGEEPIFEVREIAVSNEGVEEIIVLGTYKPSDSLLVEERYSTNILDALGVEQIERAGDSNVAVALTRLVGVTLNEGKYANVRGLDGRYISSTLNGILMPSTDPIRRDVQLDLFPSNILEGVEVQKSYSPDLLGTTTGGHLTIKTKGMPSERVAKLSISSGYNTEYTGDQVLSYQSGDSDWYGRDDGRRNLPQSVLDGTRSARSLNVGDPNQDDRFTAPFDAAVLALKLEDDWEVRDNKANPDFGLSGSFGDLVEMTNGDLGYYGAINFKHSSSNRLNGREDDPRDTTGIFQRSERSVFLSGYAAAGFNFGADDEIISKTTFLRDTDDTVKFSDGIDNQEGRSEEQVILEWVERQFLSKQVTGKHVLTQQNRDHNIEWNIAYSNTDRYEPDRRTYKTINGFLIPSTIERRWSDLNEDSYDFTAKYNTDFEYAGGIVTTLGIGALYSEKAREVDLYRISVIQSDSSLSLSADQPIESILSYQNFVNDAVRLRPTTATTDSYLADEEYTAAFVSADTELNEAWSFSLGARIEGFYQFLEYPNDPNANTGAGGEALDDENVLPALSLTFRPSDAWQFRMGASQTVSYPGLIERSRSQMYDPETDELIIGNPNLKPSNIDNVDVRAEYYFSDQESVSLALFYKDIDDPIEKALPFGSGSAAEDAYTFRQQNLARLSGLEIDVNLNVLDTDNWTGFVAGNFTYIESEVDLTADAIQLEGVDAIDRELQGQSPYLANFQFGFDHFPTNQKFTVLINYFDDRIYTVGRNLDPNIIEKGRVQLNFNYEIDFSENFNFKAQAKNILNEKVQFSQNDRVIETYELGPLVSLGVSYQFN